MKHICTGCGKSWVTYSIGIGHAFCPECSLIQNPIPKVSPSECGNPHNYIGGQCVNCGVAFDAKPTPDKLPKKESSDE